MAVIYQMVDTWNNGATTFDAIRMSVTDTASGADSTLINLLTNATSRFRVNKNGMIYAIGINGRPGDYNPISVIANSNGQDAAYQFRGSGPGESLRIASTLGITWTPTTSAEQNTPDVGFFRRAEGLLELNTGVTSSFAHIVLFTNRTVGVTFASLPGVASVSVGGRAMITNSNTATFNATAAGGGANVVPVFSDGTQWRVG